jgi:hypothetical protein
MIFFQQRKKKKKKKKRGSRLSKIKFEVLDKSETGCYNDKWGILYHRYRKVGMIIKSMTNLGKK